MKQFTRFMSTLACALVSVGFLASCGGGGTSTTSDQTSVPDSSSSEPIDMDKFPNYVENIDDLEYSFYDDQRDEPFYWGNVIYNETAMFRVQEDGRVVAKLAFKPLKIVSVRDYTHEVEYVEGVDYTIDEDGNLVLTENSSIKYWTEEQLVGQNIPAPYVKVDSTALGNTATDYYVWSGVSVYTESDFFYGHQVHVTYAYDINNLDLSKYPSYETSANLVNVRGKLEAGEDLKMVVIGDSISEGCSSSGHFGHAPNMPPFVDLFSSALGLAYGVNVTTINRSIGGTTSDDTASQESRIQAIINQNPDLLMIHYGTNDLGANTSKNRFKDNIEYIIEQIQEALPNCDIVLLSPVCPHPSIYDYTRLADYGEALAELSEDMTVAGERGVAYVDMTTAYQTYFANKTYLDLTANGINHPNDFGHRLYTQCLLGAFVDPAKKFS